MFIKKIHFLMRNFFGKGEGTSTKKKKSRSSIIFRSYKQIPGVSRALVKKPEIPGVFQEACEPCSICTYIHNKQYINNLLLGDI